MRVLQSAGDALCQRQRCCRGFTVSPGSRNIELGRRAFGGKEVVPSNRINHFKYCNAILSVYLAISARLFPSIYLSLPPPVAAAVSPACVSDCRPWCRPCSAFSAPVQPAFKSQSLNGPVALQPRRRGASLMANVTLPRPPPPNPTPPSPPLGCQGHLIYT